MATKAAQHPAPPGGTVTFLFTDIEGSTRLLQALGEQYAEVLAEQQRLLREAVHEWGGREVDASGDAFFVAFDRAREAVSAAVAVQRRLAEHRWPRDLVVRVRMGLHTGEPTLSGGRYVGIDVHRAARICAAAHGGQVLLSQTTGDIVQHGLPEQVALRDLGTHQLKDLQYPERLFQVIIPDLPSDFPALRALAGRPNNLPAQPNSFIGREEELEQVCRLLQGPARMVTLSGPGGTGKTRLALQVGASLLDAFADGVFFVPLAPVQDPGLVTARIASALGIRENPARSALDVLRDALRGQQLLLILDDFEQLVQAAGVVADLLASCPRLSVLVTSRVVLRVSGEHEFAVPPLKLPETRGGLEPETLARAPAVALFLQRARAVKAGFALTGENAGEVARICARLDGLPLAIELAAARVKLLSPHAILQRLGSRLDFLKGGPRDLPARHQTLRQAIAWSYDLLEPGERPFIRRLAVFVAGFTLEAAEQVCADLVEGGTAVLDAVTALADKSLLRQADGTEAEPRFGMLETIREYGVECLKTEGEWEPTCRAHAVTFLALAEQAETALTGPEQNQWLDRLEAEHDNLRAALAWAEERGEIETALRLGVALWRFWLARGYKREGRERLERLLALPGAAARTGARAKALHRVGTITHELSDYAEARAPLEESLSIWRELGDKRGTATALNSLGWLAYQGGDFGSTLAMSQEALEFHRALGDRRGIAVALFNLGFVALHRSDYAEAQALLEESLALRRGIGDRRGSAYVQIHLGWIEHQRGSYQRASQVLEEARTAFRELSDRQLLAWSLASLGLLAYDLGELDRARVLLEESLSLAREVGNQAITAWALSHLGEVLHSQGTPELATPLLDEGLALYRQIGNLWGLPRALHGRGLIAQAAGQFDRAAALYLEGLDVWARLRAKRGAAICLEAVAGLALARGNPEPAARLYAAADAAREAVGAPRPPRVGAAHEQSLAAVRRQMGEGAFAAAWTEGRGLTLEQARDHAHRALSA